MEAKSYDSEETMPADLPELRIVDSPLIRRDSSGSGFYLSADDMAMKLIHALQLHMLVEIDRICRAEDIDYFLLFGTLLGAVRHKGFIPWDDDIDIGIMREDYDRLLEALESRLDHERFDIQYAGKDHSVPVPYAKLRAKSTRFEEFGRTYGNLSSGIFIDLFPLDNVPDSSMLRARQKAGYFMTHFSRRVKHDNYRTRHLPLQLLYESQARMPSDRLWAKNLDAMTRYGHGASKLLIAYPGARSDYDSSFMHRADMTPASRLPFCGFMVKAPARVETVLQKAFGDYMNLPPEDQRRGHLLSYIEIDLRFWQDVFEEYLPAVIEQHEYAKKQITR